MTFSAHPLAKLTLLASVAALYACGGGGSNTPAPSALIAANETASTVGNTPAVINLLANDTTSNAGGVLAVIGIPTVSNGTLTLSGSTITVTPTVGFVGDMVVSYVVGDGKAPNINETATIAVTDPIPTGAALANVTMGDNIGLPLVTTINAGGATDSLGRAITYTATGLPAGLSINGSTGIISGQHDAFGNETFSVTVTATPAGGTHPLVRTFTLSLIDEDI